MEITLIIPAYNEEAYLGGCLDSINRYAPGKFKEVVVVDNASTDKTAEVARAKGARVVREDRKGLTHARQSGFEQTSGEYVAYMDADCRLTPNWFETAERHLTKHPEAVSLTGPVRYYDGPAYLKALVIPLQWITLPIPYFTAGFLIIGGNFIARRSALQEIGGFDRGIVFYGEDADIARRLSKSGPTLLRMDFPIETSARRLLKEGIMRTYTRYTVNLLWHVFFKRSFTKTYTDQRA
ncbi:MAG: glycosyl transferase family 2 [Candidatus Kaiserbacteria bacterium]|nr:glycosyl transferase family 2 [Candidatus Kaiserbacteria bacterium]